MTEVGKKFVSPHCSRESSPAWWGGRAGAADFASGGTCQECNTNNVATQSHGLQCSNRGHWVCWPCMIKGIDWKKVRLYNTFSIQCVARNMYTVH